MQRNQFRGNKEESNKHCIRRSAMNMTMEHPGVRGNGMTSRLPIHLPPSPCDFPSSRSQYRDRLMNYPPPCLPTQTSTTSTTAVPASSHHTPQRQRCILIRTTPSSLSTVTMVDLFVKLLSHFWASEALHGVYAMCIRKISRWLDDRAIRVYPITKDQTASGLIPESWLERDAKR